MAVAVVAISGQSVQADNAGSGAVMIGFAASVEFSAATVAPFGPDQLNEMNSGGSNCTHPCSSGCGHTSGFSCCGPSILADLLRLVPGATAGGGFDVADSAVTGSDPGAPQEPPQNAA